jgi:hypothetical protein
MMFNNDAAAKGIQILWQKDHGCWGTSLIGLQGIDYLNA